MDGGLPLPDEILRREDMDGAPGRTAGLAVAVGHALPAVGYADSFVRQILKIDGRSGMVDPQGGRSGRSARFGRIAPRIEHYDCIIVGGGASGLASAKFYQDRFGADARILVLEALPQFDVASFAPSSAGAAPPVDPIPATCGLRDVLFFDRADFGSDQVVADRGADEPDTEAGWRAFLARTPYDAAAVEAIVRIQTGRVDHLEAAHGPLTREQKIDRLSRITYRQYLLRYAGATDQSLLHYQRSPQTVPGSATAVSALDMWLQGAPGFAGLSLGEPTDGSSPASAERLLAQLIPGSIAGPGAGPDHATLDNPANAVRLRLNSLVVKVRPAVRSRGLADVLYVPTGTEGLRSTARLARATHVVMACWNRVTAQLVEGLPRRQVKCLTYTRGVPVIHGRVNLTNWRAFADTSTRSISPRGDSVPWDRITLTVGAAPDAGPADPAVLHVTTLPTGTRTAIHERRADVPLRRSLADLEANLLDLVTRCVAAAGGRFDPGEDVSDIMIRWNSGQAHETTSAWEPTTDRSDHDHTRGRLPFRNIAIATSDRSPSAGPDSAFTAGYRAVQDLPVATPSTPSTPPQVVATAI